VLINEQDQMHYQKRLPNDLTTILEQLAPYHTEIEGLVVESTYNWYWLVDGLMDAGYRLHLANPAAIQQYSGIKYTHDQSDARWLAHMLRLGVLPEGYIYPEAQQPVRDLLRKRGQLVHQQTANVLSVQNILVRNTGSRLSANRIKGLSQAEVDVLLPDLDQALAVSSALAVVSCLAKQIKAIEKRVRTRMQRTPLYDLLQTVDGMGPILAQTILLETGDIGRFPRVGDYASYCRCVDSTKVSHGKRKGQGNVKNGNPYLSWAYAEAATFAIRLNPRGQRYYQRKQAETNVPVARKTVAHKLARACYHMMRHPVAFDEAKAFG
jgi:transposase